METLVVIGLLIGALVLGEKLVSGLRTARRSPEEHALFERARLAVPPAGPTTEQRKVLKGCASCGQAAITLPFKDGSGRTYCSEDCLLWGALGPTEFCARCQAQSDGRSSAGDMSRFNGIGRTFGKASERCPQCRSVVRRVWFTVLYVPLIPLGKYRVLHASPQQFWSQRLRSA
jgi:hypothetical protein